MIVAIISRTLEYVVSRLKEAVPMPTPVVTVVEKKGHESSRAKRRRRRRRILKLETVLSDDESSESKELFGSSFELPMF